MLMLLLNVGNERYAIAIREVVEVVPLVKLKTLPHQPPHFAGVFNYHGQIISVIDLCQLLRGTSCSDRLSTRIIIVNYYKPDHTQDILGLMAEKVVETLYKPESEFVEANLQFNTQPYLGKIILDDKGMIQCIRIEYLLSETEQIHLLT